MDITKDLLIHLDRNGLESKSHADLVNLCDELLDRVRTLEERLNKNSSNSSISPSTFILEQAVNDSKFQKNIEKKEASKDKMRKQRAQSFGREQVLPVTAIQNLYPDQCTLCHHAFNVTYSQTTCFTAYYQLDLEKGDGALGGYMATHTKYNLYGVTCEYCHQSTCYQPKQISTTEEKVIARQWQLIGPTLASIIAYLKYDIGSTIRKIQRLLVDFFQIHLSVGAICNSLHETGLSAEPITEQLKETISQVDLLHADETGWKEKKKSLWLWVFITINTCLFMVGGRTKKMAQTFLKGNDFDGWLMSDGYLAYRDYQKRFRCWAHLERKAKGIQETNWIDGINFGEFVLEHFKKFKAAIYDLRKSNQAGQSLKVQFQKDLAAFQVKCEYYINSNHTATKALAREFLNDWDCIFRILEHPDYPLTNNEAERALRHWVIIRKITQGTRSPIGSKALSILASIIATCRLRAVKTIDFVKNTIVSARSGNPLPVYQR